MKFNERIDKIIASTGKLTRSGCKKAASQNRITVDGKIEKKCDRKINETDVNCQASRASDKTPPLL